MIKYFIIYLFVKNRDVEINKIVDMINELSGIY